MTTTASIPTAEGRYVRYQVLGFLCLSAAIAYVQRASLSVPALEIARDLKFPNAATDMGKIQSAWYLAYGLMQLPGGYLADRIGSRRTLAILSVTWSLATFLSAFAFDFYSLLILWALMGAAQAGAFPSAAKALGQLFPEAERARATGLLASGMTVGGALAPLLTAVFLESIAPIASSLHLYRWQLLLATYAIPGFIWTLLFLILIPETKLPGTLAKKTIHSHIEWSRILTSKSLALLCAQQFFRAAGMVFFLTWFPTFLQKTRGVSLLSSGLLTTITGAGSAIGSMTGGFFSDWLLKKTGSQRISRQGIAVVGMTTCSLLILTSHFIHNVNGSIALISLGTFCASFGGVSGYTVAIRFGGRKAATVFGSMNMFGNFGAALFPLTAGWLVARTGNWNLILFLFAGIMAIDAVCWAFLNPQGTLSGDENDQPQHS